MMSRYRGRTFATYLEGVRLPLSSAAPGFIGDVGAIRMALRYGHDVTREESRSFVTLQYYPAPALLLP